MKSTNHLRIAIITCIGFLIAFIGNAQEGFPVIQGEYMYHYPKYFKNPHGFEDRKKMIKEALDAVGQVYDVKNKKELNAKDIKEVLILDDRIEIEAKSKKNNLTYYFPRLIDSTMIFYTYQNSWHYVYFPSLVNFVFADINKAQLFADNMYVIQYPLIDKRRDSLITVFKPIATKYHALKSPPTVSEEQRKMFIQADNLHKQNKLFDAIKMYKKAIDLDKISFVSAYSNLALLYAKANFFDYAIYYMKLYLMLVPDAEDARAAQDKIYAWEGLIGK